VFVSLCFRRRCLVHFTAKSFKSFIDAYKSIYQVRHREIESQLQKIGGGLEKMEDALSCVSEMKTQLTEKEKLVAAETAKTDDARSLVR